MGISFKKLTSKIADPVGNLINGLTGVNSQMDKSYKQQLGAMEAQNAYNTYMWNLANEYNTPAAQLARMEAAGIDINPTSYALGTGNLSNTAGMVSSSSGFSGSGSPAGNPITMAMGVANGIQGIRESKARTKLDEANIANAKEQNINIMQAGQKLFNDTESSRIANEIARHNLKYAEAHNKPVGWSPTATGAPFHYGAEVLADTFIGGLGLK